jgi:hypothetical protein
MHATIVWWCIRTVLQHLHLLPTIVRCTAVTCWAVQGVAGPATGDPGPPVCWYTAAADQVPEGNVHGQAAGSAGHFGHEACQYSQKGG